MYRIPSVKDLTAPHRARDRIATGRRRLGRESFPVPALRLAVEPLDLPLKHTFTIARTSESIAHTTVVRLHWNGLEGLGESAPIARYRESVESVTAGLAARDLGDDPYAFERLLDGLSPARRASIS